MQFHMSIFKPCSSIYIYAVHDIHMTFFLLAKCCERDYHKWLSTRSISFWCAVEFNWVYVYGWLKIFCIIKDRLRNGHIGVNVATIHIYIYIYKDASNFENSIPSSTDIYMRTSASMLRLT